MEIWRLNERDTALQHLDPLLEERRRLINEVVRTHAELRDTPTNSSGAVDLTYDAAAAAHQYEKRDADQRCDNQRHPGIP